jgi:3-methylcrotonyl-CoA carboxylase alpha subunit
MDQHAFRIEWTDALGGLAVSESGREFFRAAWDGSLVWVRWRGRTYRVDVRRLDAGSDSRPSSEEPSLRAPMPGLVLALRVRPGQFVERGELVLVLEAMKMEHEIRAPERGRVKRVLCAPGERVQADALLVELAPVRTGPDGEPPP